MPYTIPKADVQIAMTHRSTLGNALAANFAATNAYLAANSNLGRTLSGNAANTSLSIANPVTDAVYLDRDHQVDFRVGKVFRLSKTRATVNLDMYNLLNRSTVLTANATYALTNNPWLTPTAISNPRLFKVSFTFDMR